MSGALLGRGSDFCERQALSEKYKIILHQDDMISAGKLPTGQLE